MSIATALFRVSLALVCLAPAALAQSGPYQTQFELNGSGGALCGGESALGNLIANGVRESTASDAAIVPCRVIRRGGLIEANSFIAETELRALVSDEQVKFVDIKGFALLDALETIFAADIQGSDQFPQVAGLRIEVDLRRSIGGRLVRVTVNGAALELEKTYRIAVPQSYAAFDMGNALPSPGMSLADSLVKYARSQSTLKVTTFGRIKLNQ